MSNRPSKKPRTATLPLFGAPSSSDTPSNQINDPSSSSSSTRLLPILTTPSLTTLCARAFASNFVKLRKTEANWKRTSKYLRALPDPWIPKMFALLRASHPTFLHHEFIVTYMLRGDSVTLRSDLPGVNKATLTSIARINPALLELELDGFDKITDSVFGSILRHLPSLRVIILRGCTKAGSATAEAAALTCHNLRTINLSYTSVAPASLAPLVSKCQQLEVLKLAGIQNWTDATFSYFIASVGSGLRLPALHTLKIRQTSLSDVSLSFFLSLCPGLRRLDASFTLVRHPPALLQDTQILALEKLSLTSTEVSASDLLGIVTRLPQLRTLSLGALGASRGSRASIGNSSAMMLNDDTLDALTKILDPFPYLENINLVGNIKLGTTSKGNGALSRFISRVGRRCKKLNLAGISSLRSSDFSGLIPTEPDGSVSPLETLILNNTGIDDEVGVYISTCSFLGTLGVAGTKVTDEGLYPIINGCLKLENLDLTSCRGVSVVHRRRFFEVWEAAQRTEIS